MLYYILLFVMLMEAPFDQNARQQGEKWGILFFSFLFFLIGVLCVTVKERGLSLKSELKLGNGKIG